MRRAAQVACGGYHTLAVVKHDLREAEVDAARRGPRQWTKPKMDLTVEIPADADAYQNGQLSAAGGASAIGLQHSGVDPMATALAAPGPGKGALTSNPYITEMERVNRQNFLACWPRSPDAPYRV